MLEKCKLPLPVSFKALHKRFGRGGGVGLFAGIIVVEVHGHNCVCEIIMDIKFMRHQINKAHQCVLVLSEAPLASD